MYSRLGSYPVSTTHPADPHRQFLHYPLAKPTVLPPQVSTQVAFPRPTLSISSSRSSPHSFTSGSSSEFPVEDGNQYPLSVTRSSTMSSQQSSLSHRALLQGRPLPQVPPLPMPPVPIPPPVNTSHNSPSLVNSSPITSPSSPTTLRPKRALPIIPPSPHTPQMPGPAHLSASPATSSVGSSDVCISPPQSSSVEPSSKLRVNLSVDLSPTTAVIQRLPHPRYQPQTRVTVRRVNAEASSSRVQLPPRSPVSLEDLAPPLPVSRPKLKVETSQLTKAATESNDHPKRRIQTPPRAEPNSAPFVQTKHQFPQQVHPLPRVPDQTDLPSRVQNLPRRSSLDSLTTRSSALLSPGQALSPYVSKRPKSRRFSRSPQQYGFLDDLPESGSDGAPGLSVTGTRITEATPTSITGRSDRGLVVEGDMGEPISPLKFTKDNSDREHDEDPDFVWDEASPGHGSHSVVESRTYFWQRFPLHRFG